jgi:glycosyltransferase involved in cell wall biosynthesis
MTIRFILMNGFAVGGTIRTTFTLAAELADRHDVEIVSVYRRRDRPALPLPAGVRFRVLADLRPERLERLAAGRSPGGRWNAWAASRRSRVMSSSDVRYPTFTLLSDVMLVRYLLSLRDGIAIGTRPAINLALAHLTSPSVVRVGQDHMNLESYSPALRAQIRAGYPRLDLVSTLTERDAEAYRLLLAGTTRVVCVPNGVPALGGARAALDAKVVVAAGRLEPRKGFDRLLSAWAKLVPRHPGWELRIFGSGREQSALRRQIADLGIADSARIMGYTRRLHEEFAAASMFVMSSRREGFPMVLLEAMGVGLPVVSFDCPTGPREIIREGVDGHVVPDGDVERLAVAMGRLMDDAERRKAFGAAALERAVRYDIGAIGERWGRLLHEAAQSKDGRRHGVAGHVASLLAHRARARLPAPGRR